MFIEIKKFFFNSKKNNLKYNTLYSATLPNVLYGILNDNVADTKVGVYLVVFRVKKKIVID